MVQCISHMHPTLIKAIGCVTGVIEFLPLKTSAVVNDVKALSHGKRLMVYWCFSSIENQRIEKKKKR